MSRSLTAAAKRAATRLGSSGEAATKPVLRRREIAAWGAAIIHMSASRDYHGGMTQHSTAIILAAGQGTRMKSDLPKVLHSLCGAPMIDFVVRAALEAGADDAVVVVGHARELVEAHLKQRFGSRVRIAVQAEQNGTGHAVACALSALDEKADTALLLCGDTPLLRAEDLAGLLAARGAHKLAMLTCAVADPTGYGRILRAEDGAITGIREHRDCSDEQRLIQEINPGVFAAELAFLRTALAQLEPNNDQGELYLTDIVAAAANRGTVQGLSADAASLGGINDRAQLAAAEATLFVAIGDALRRAGATIRHGAQIELGVKVERDAIIEHGVVLRGATTIGAGARVDVGCVLDNVEVAAGAYLKPYAVCSEATIGESAQIGPLAHLRPGSRVDESARVGNFVEMKNTRLRPGAKANHLSYIGDSDIGEGSNIGAGTIFCNYDGYQKHKTTIGRDVFVGSDSQIVAPITIGDGAFVATGTTVTQDVPADALAIARLRQETKAGYAPRLRARLKSAAKRAKEDAKTS